MTATPLQIGLELFGAPQPSLRWAGSVPGVAVTEVAAVNLHDIAGHTIWGVERGTAQLGKAMMGRMIYAAAPREPIVIPPVFRTSGAGSLQIAAGGKSISWRAPGSATFGPKVDVSAGGDFVLIDGDDCDRWISVHIYAAFLPASDHTRTVHLQEHYAYRDDGADPP